METLELDGRTPLTSHGCWASYSKLCRIAHDLQVGISGSNDVHVTSNINPMENLT